MLVVKTGGGVTSPPLPPLTPGCEPLFVAPGELALLPAEPWPGMTLVPFPGKAESTALEGSAGCSQAAKLGSRTQQQASEALRTIGDIRNGTPVWVGQVL